MYWGKTEQLGKEGPSQKKCAQLFYQIFSVHELLVFKIKIFYFRCFFLVRIICNTYKAIEIDITQEEKNTALQKYQK